MSNINDGNNVNNNVDPGASNGAAATGAAVAAAGAGAAPSAGDSAAAWQDTALDKIIIADEVITQIILIAAGKTAGITLPSSGVGDGIAGFLGMKGPPRGIRIESDESSVGVDITISVEYGLKIIDIAKTLQEEIRSDLSKMTGLDVTHVNVHVTSVNTKEPPASKPQKASKTQQKDAIAEDSAADDAQAANQREAVSQDIEQKQ